MKYSNPELELAKRYVLETDTTLFLTGKAGTGKTTFLQSLRENCSKRMIVTAPTGVAAINAGGVTLHSFFQLPFSPFVPGGEHTRSQYRFSKEKINIIKNLDLLVIDEISMVRADLLDAVDSVLRRYRWNSDPFGGVQLLLIGDLHQLPPVVKHDEQHILNSHYDSPFFFSSKALGQCELITIELKHIYRQAESSFIDLLNKVRNNNLDAGAIAALSSRVKADLPAGTHDEYITLCTHNRSADQINEKKLGELDAKLHFFEAELEGEFPEHTYPASATLGLKQEARVMFIRNDHTPEKRFYNGKTGVITRITDKTICVKCDDDHEVIEVEQATWENIEYSLNPESLEISEKKIGSFSQYPLRLAWAITIHKSQGLSFDKAVIDAQAAFAHGQVYVALSRCRTYEGLVLTAPLSQRALKSDPAIVDFTHKSRRNIPDETHLREAAVQFQQRLILECFNFQRTRSLLGRLVSIALGNHSVVRFSGVEDIGKVQGKAEEVIFTVSRNFHNQLHTLFDQGTPPAENPVILERLAKASAYFSESLKSILIHPLGNLHIETDNKEIGKKCNRTRQLLEEELAIKLAAVLSCSNGFSPQVYFHAVSRAATDVQQPKRKPPTTTYTESDVVHPKLFQTLKLWRSRKAEEQNIAHFQVLHQKTLIQIVVHLPDTLEALKKIKGIGEVLARKYGDELVEIVSNYRLEHNIEEVVLPNAENGAQPPPKKKNEKIDTKKLTLDLFHQGLTVMEIAEKRNLTRETIEKHIAYQIENGEIAIEQLLSQEKLAVLLEEVEKMQGKKLKEIKDSINSDATYGEIHFILAHIKHQAASGSI